MPIGGIHPVAHKKHWHIPTLDYRYPVGAKFRVKGDSSELWLQDYNVRVNTIAEIEEKPSATAKKVLVRLYNIDGDSNVWAYIKKSALTAENRLGGFMVKDITTSEFLKQTQSNPFLTKLVDNKTVWFEKSAAQTAISFEQKDHPDHQFEIIPVSDDMY